MEVLIISCDKNSDIWKPFNTLYKKYWKHNYKTYIVTEELDCEYFETIKVKGSWTARVRQALEQIDSENVLLLLDDFFFHKKVNQKRIEQILGSYSPNTAVYNLERLYYIPKNKTVLNGFIERENKEPYLNSCQPSIWNRKILIERLKGDKTPWEWELTTIDSPYKHYINVDELIFDIGYYEDKKPWCIVQGKWSTETIELFKREEIEIDFDKRGICDMQLSIIIPYYKTLELTKKLLDVLVPQLNKDVEVILVDDGCNGDWTKYPIKAIHKKNGGVSSARNVGINHSNGKYIAFVDSDDMISNDYVDKILNKIKSEKFDYCYISWKNNANEKFIITDLPLEWNHSVWKCIYKREMIGNVRFNEKLQIAEEEIFNIECTKGKKANIVDVLYYYNNGRKNSLIDRYSRGEITMEKQEILKAQIVIFRSFLSIIGGIETAVHNACNLLKNSYDIVFLYDNCDRNQLIRLKKEVRCVKYTGQKIECDVLLLYGFNPSHVFGTTKAKRVIQQICCNVKDVDFGYVHNEAITEFFADSDASAKQFMEFNPKFKCGTLHNLFNIKEPKRCLRIMSATRLSWEKGYDKMKAMAKRMHERSIPFIWTVFTDDKPDEDIEDFIFMKPRLNVIDYIKGNDFGFQGSKSESWGNTVTEFLECGVPVVANEWASVREQIDDGINGYILKDDLSNLDDVIDKMYLKYLKFEYKPKYSIDEWKKIFGKEKKSNYVYDENEPVPEDKLDVWVALTRVKDDNGQVFQEGQEVINLSSSRVRLLLGNNLIRRK